MRFFWAFIFVAISISAFAADEVTFSSLECRIEGNERLNDYEKSFKALIRFHSKVNAINDTSSPRRLKADVDLSVLNSSGEKLDLKITNLIIVQENRFYGYELHTSGPVMKSAYASHLSIQPQFKDTFFNRKLKEVSGTLELNGKVESNDELIVKTGPATELVCRPVL